VNIFVLYLNDMRSPKIEIVEPVAASNDRAALVAWMEGELHRNEAGVIEAWSDTSGEETGHHNTRKWGKSFKKGGPLEWYNKPWEGTQADDPEKKYSVLYGHGRVGIHEIIPLDAAVQREMEQIETNLRDQYEALRGLHQPGGPIQF
jgi:hypothetical protein